MDEAIGTKMAGKSKEFEIGEARCRRVPKGRPEEIQETQGKRGKDQGNGTATLSPTPMRTGYLEDVWGKCEKSKWDVLEAEVSLSLACSHSADLDLVCFAGGFTSPAQQYKCPSMFML